MHKVHTKHQKDYKLTTHPGLIAVVTTIVLTVTHQAVVIETAAIVTTELTLCKVINKNLTEIVHSTTKLLYCFSSDI